MLTMPYQVHVDLTATMSSILKSTTQELTPPSEGMTPLVHTHFQNPLSLFTSRDDVVQIIIREEVWHQT